MINLLRIMVVEDETVIAALLTEVLKGMGHDVCAVEATEAGAIFTAGVCQPDLMIVDARLGDGSGVFAVAEILKSRFIPHVFVSGDSSRVQALRPDAVVLQKPFRELDLTRAMQRVLATATIN